MVLIVVDTLRADHLSSDGYVRPTTPAMDGLAAEGIRFTRAYATAPWTKPSIASMFTGRHPSGHGLQRVDETLPLEDVTLAEYLRDQGFVTEGIVSHELIGHLHGFDQGFDYYSQLHARGHGYVSTPGVVEEAEGRLERLARDGRRFLLFVHLFDPHYDYQHHPDVGYAPQRAGRLDGSESIHELRSLAADLTSEEQQFLVALYDEEVRFTDRGIEQLVRELASLGLLDDTLVVLTADHGEELAERGWIGHTRTLFEEVLRVPLILRTPASPHRPAVVEMPVSLAALPATILELLGLPAPRDLFPVASLVPSWRGGASPTPVFSEVDYRPLEGGPPAKRARLRSVIVGDHKLIYDDLRSAVAVFDLARDPGETVNLATDRALLEPLARTLEEETAKASTDAIVAPRLRFSQEERESLRALGYVDSE